MKQTKGLEVELRLAWDIFRKIEKNPPTTISAYRGGSFYKDFEPIDPPERAMLADNVRGWGDDCSRLKELIESAEKLAQSHGFQSNTTNLVVAAAFLTAHELYSKYRIAERRNKYFSGGRG